MKTGALKKAFTIFSLFFFSFSILPITNAADDKNSSNSRQIIKESQSLEKQGKSEEALSLLRQTSSANPNDRQLSKARNALQSKLAKQYFNEGLKLYGERQYQKALVFFDQALSQDPGFRRATQYRESCLKRLDPPSEENPSREKTSPRVDGRGKDANLAKARIVFEQGRALLNQGKFDEAQEKFEETLELNPYNVVARKYVVLLQGREHSKQIENQAISEEARMIEVREEWLPPPKKKFVTEITPPWKVPVGVSEARKRLEAQSQQVIPAINFNNAHLSDVVKYLSKISGINIIVDESVFEVLSPEEAPVEQAPSQSTQPLPPEGAQTNNNAAPAPSAAAAPGPSSSLKSDRVTIALKDVPLIEAVKYVLKAKGLRYILEDYAIIIVAADYVPAEELETRYYHLSSGVGAFTSFELNASTAGSEKKLSSEGAGEEGKSAETITIKDILEQSGVPWPEGSKIFLDQRTGTLIVRNTPTNLKIVEDILRTLDVAPYQVAITARFIELENTDAEELGLEWLLRDDLKFFENVNSSRGLIAPSALPRTQFDRLKKTVGTQSLDQSFSGNERFFTTDSLTGQITSSLTGAASPLVSFSGILTRPEFSIVLHAINQKTKNNLLSSPRVTTVNGQRAQIKIVQEFIYPTEYEVTAATTNSNGTVTTPPVVTPGNFETRDIGIVLDVTPNVGADRKTINLTIIPEVSEFVTWLDYGVPTQSFKGIDGVVRTLPGYPILQPLFATRNVTTSVIVNDGDTVVLGGLIRDEVVAYNDKIPFLGDIPILGLLFRKKGEISKKKNLVIFVTAELLTPSGEPYGPTQMETGETLVHNSAPDAAVQPTVQAPPVS